MKDETIRESWDRIRPDEAADARMHGAVMEYQHSHRGRPAVWKWAVPALCLLLAAAILLFTSTPRVQFKENRYTVKPGGGNTLEYVTGEPAGSAKFAYDYEVNDRELTAQEILTLFPSFSRTSEENYFSGVFKTGTGEMVRAEGRIDGIMFFLAQAGLAPSDCIITGAPERENLIGGVPVKAGYALFAANSKGVRNTVFFAEFEINRTTVYAEIAGNEKDSLQLCEKLSEAVYEMIRRNAPDISAVRFE